MTLQRPSEQAAKLELEDKHVVITGGTHGIGATAASLCVAAGARVSLCSRNAAEVAQAAKTNGERAFGKDCDVSEPLQVESFFDAAQGRFGYVHGVIHAAAIQGPIGSIVDLDPQKWLAAIKVDLFGTFLVVREACKRMREQGGRIAIFSGGGAGAPFPNYTAYACSKVGVVRFVESVAIETADANIAINAVAPGFVATRMQQETLAAGEAAGSAYFLQTQKALQSGAVAPEVGAHCAAWLLSDAAKGISGKFVAAPYDDYASWPQHLDQLEGSDLFTLRRIVPKDRGLHW